MSGREQRVEELARKLYTESVLCDGFPADAASGRFLAESCFDAAEWFEDVADAERSAIEQNKEIHK